MTILNLKDRVCLCAHVSVSLRVQGVLTDKNNVWKSRRVVYTELN